MRHKNPLIEPGSPFLNCKLGREKYGHILTEIVSTNTDGFVLSINNIWGAGKTTFIKMWQQQLIDRSYETIYFNAWENDFEDNAFAAILGELKLFNETHHNTQVFQKLLHKATIISKNVVPQLLKSLFVKYTGVQDLGEFVSNAAHGFGEIFEKEVEQYTQKKQSIEDFKQSLREFIQTCDGPKPFIFIIDELDRCRPNYAVSVLEQIKHLFSVDGIVFVLSIDKQQLGNAVRGVYGTDLIDADEYLRRFIDVEFSLPKPDVDLYINYLFSYFEFNAVFKANASYSDDVGDLKQIAYLFFDNVNISLRQQEKIFAHCKLVLKSFSNSRRFYPPLVFSLIFIRILHFDFYKGIINQDYDLQGFHKAFLGILTLNKIDGEKSRIFSYVEAYLIYFYYRLSHDNLQTSNELLNESFEIPSLFSDRKDIGIIFKGIFHQGYGFEPQKIIDRIELLERIV